MNLSVEFTKIKKKKVEGRERRKKTKGNERNIHAACGWGGGGGHAAPSDGESLRGSEPKRTQRESAPEGTVLKSEPNQKKKDKRNPKGGKGVKVNVCRWLIWPRFSFFPACSDTEKSSGFSCASFYTRRAAALCQLRGSDLPTPTFAPPRPRSALIGCMRNWGGGGTCCSSSEENTKKAKR